MANYPNYNLYGKRPADTFRNIVQFNITASNLVDSYGDELPTINISASVSGTASWANNAVSASWAPDQTVTVNSASWASQSLSASWAPSAAQVEQISASWASSSLSSSYVLGNAVHGPVLDAISASYADQALSASWAPSTQIEQVSASWASQSLSASWAPGDGSGTLLTTGSTYEVTASWSNNSVSASYAPQVEQVSASWASQSLSASVLFNNSAFVNVDGYAQFGDTTLSQSFGPTFTLDNPTLSNEFENTPAGILEFKCNEWSGSAARRTVVRITATKDGTVPYGGASGRLVVGVEDTSGGVYDRMLINRFATSFSGSVVATEADNYGRAGFTGSLNGTASNAVSASWAPFTQTEQVSASWASASISASWAPTSITYPLTVLATNLETASIDFLAGQYFQLDTTASIFTFGDSTNVVAVRNASVYITAQSGSRTIVFNPSWVVMGNSPTTIAHNSASILSLTTFGTSETSVVAAFASKV